MPLMTSKAGGITKLISNAAAIAAMPPRKVSANSKPYMIAAARQQPKRIVS